MASSALAAASLEERAIRPATAPSPRRWPRAEALLVLAAVAGPLAIYLSFGKDLSPVYRFWDGPAYLTISHELYEVRPGNPLAPDVHRPPFYLAQLPLYPLAVRALAFIGYERALLAVSILATIAAVLLFYRLARDVWRVPSPAFLSYVFLFFPPTWVLYRSVGASEPLFIALVLASIFFFEKSRFGLASLAGGLAALTRHSGVMILPAFFLVLFVRGRRRPLAWLLLIPLGFSAYVAWCALRFGDPLAAFELGLERVATPLPFVNQLRINSWPSHHFSEFYILMTLITAIGIVRLRRFPVLLSYCAFQFVFMLFVSAGDWVRYNLAVTPFALILGYRDVFTSRPFRWMFPAVAVVSVHWAIRTIPFNDCDPAIYGELLRHLGIAGVAPLP